MTLTDGQRLETNKALDKDQIHTSEDGHQDE
jgi:hypothetical protein